MLLLRSRGVRVLPGGVVSHVEDLDDLGQLLPDHRLDALLQRDVAHAAPLTATAHLQVDHLVLDVDERHHPAVTGDGGVDRRVEQVLDLRSDPGVLSLLPITPRAHIGHGVRPPCCSSVSAFAGLATASPDFCSVPPNHRLKSPIVAPFLTSWSNYKPCCLLLQRAELALGGLGSQNHGSVSLGGGRRRHAPRCRPVAFTPRQARYG